MRAIVRPGTTVSGELGVPGDKSIAHRWIILASIAEGASRLREVPAALDVRSTGACVAKLVPRARPSLDLWVRTGPDAVEGGGSTWNGGGPHPAGSALEVEGEGLDGLREADTPLDCGNSGTTMRLLTGLVAGRPFRTVLTGDESLSTRPMERVAAPLRAMGAVIGTDRGHAPVSVDGRSLIGARTELTVPSAQVKSALLLAGLSASGTTTVVETTATRDHTERALAALGVPIEVDGRAVSLTSAAFPGFDARVPGDPSSAAFLIAAAALGGAGLQILEVGLNPSRLHFLDVLARMGVHVERVVEREELGEPVGRLILGQARELVATDVTADEIPLVIDEVPVLAALAAHARGTSRFLATAELRVKESDRVAALAGGIVALGGRAEQDGDDLIVLGQGLAGGNATSHRDHRIAMALAVAALAADSTCSIEGIDAAAVSFPGFPEAIRSLGANIEVRP
jgi:3-phosphoshikimate 1-carboxyvinyltransferase